MAPVSFFKFVSENGCACKRSTTRSVREKVGFGCDANSWKICKSEEDLTQKSLAKLWEILLRICVTV
jgi:hypothetical protein